MPIIIHNGLTHFQPVERAVSNLETLTKKVLLTLLHGFLFRRHYKMFVCSQRQPKLELLYNMTFLTKPHKIHFNLLIALEKRELIF